MPDHEDRIYSELALRGTLLNHVRSGVIATDVNGTITHWNRYAEHLFQWTAEEAIGRNIIDLTVPPPGRSNAAKILGVALVESGYWEGEFLVQRKDGSTFPAFVTDSVIRDKDGVLTGFVGVSTDITEQKRAQDEIKSAKDRLHVALHAARMVAWEWNTKTGDCDRIGDLSDLGMALPDDGSSFFDLIHPGDRARVHGAITATIERGESFSEEYRIVRPDGAVRWLSDRGSRKSDSTGLSVVLTGVAQDITARKDAEASERQNELRLHIALQASDLGIWDLDLDTLMVTSSLRHDQIFGYPAGCPEWSSARFMEHVHPDERDRVNHILEQTINAGAPCEFECRIVRADGVERSIAVQGLIQPGSGGKSRRLTGVVRDITQHNLREAQFREAQKIESIGVLAAGIAHDFNNLLISIMGNASLAADMMPPAHPATEMLVEVIRNSERAADLTRKLLAYAGKGYFQMELVDVSELVRSHASYLLGVLPPHVAMRTELYPSLPHVKADRRHLQQIVTNLVLNGAEAIDPRAPGTVTLITYAKPDPDSGEPCVCLDVRDTGCGMDAATVSRIFDPFFSSKFLGRGLGLAAVQGIARAHGGQITVISFPGHGSTFRLTLPATAP